jgi:hypothetical protein
MLTHEDSILHSDKGQCVYKNPVNRALYSLEPQFVINRLTLSHFGFDTSKESVETYRSIFRNYYIDPTHYDQEVLSCSTYMRENRLMFYQTPHLEVGGIVPDCDLLFLDPSHSESDLKSESLNSILTKESAQYYLLHAFSTS